MLAYCGISLSAAFWQKRLSLHIGEKWISLHTSENTSRPNPTDTIHVCYTCVTHNRHLCGKNVMWSLTVVQSGHFCQKCEVLNKLLCLKKKCQICTGKISCRVREDIRGVYVYMYTRYVYIICRVGILFHQNAKIFIFANMQR